MSAKLIDYEAMVSKIALEYASGNRSKPLNEFEEFLFKNHQSKKLDDEIVLYIYYYTKKIEGPGWEKDTFFNFDSFSKDIHSRTLEFITNEQNENALSKILQHCGFSFVNSATWNTRTQEFICAFKNEFFVHRLSGEGKVVIEVCYFYPLKETTVQANFCVEFPNTMRDVVFNSVTSELRLKDGNEFKFELSKNHVNKQNYVTNKYYMTKISK